MKIGLVPMAGKPVHAGHWGLIMLAASENDAVKVFASTGDRDFIKGADMMKIWRDFLIPELPSSVDVEFVPVPVRSVYDELVEGETSGSKDVYVIYSDAEDILKYKQESLKKNAPTLFKKKQIQLRGVERTSTVNVSGTEMRSLLTTGTKKDKKKFISFLPPEVQVHGEEIYNILSRGSKNESLLRSYIKFLIA